MRIHFFTLPLLFVATGCGVIEGNGISITEQRSVSAYSRLRVKDGLSAELSTSGERGAVVSGDENLVPLVRVHVDGEVLIAEVDAPGMLRAREPLRLVLLGARPVAVDASGGSAVFGQTVRQGDFEIESSGGARVELSDLDVTALKVTSSGGSSVHLTGVAPRANVRASGGAVFEGSELAAEELEVDGSGGAQLNARACCAVRGELSGGARLRLWGQPRTQALRISGGARVELQ